MIYSANSVFFVLLTLGFTNLHMLLRQPSEFFQNWRAEFYRDSKQSTPDNNIKMPPIVFTPFHPKILISPF